MAKKNTLAKEKNTMTEQQCIEYANKLPFKTRVENLEKAIRIIDFHIGVKLGNQIKELKKENLGLYEKINQLEEIIYQMQCDLNDITEKE